MGERFGAASAGAMIVASATSRASSSRPFCAPPASPRPAGARCRTGTGLAIEASLEAVGPLGHVVATDLFPAMFEKARERLGHLADAPRVNTAGDRGEHTVRQSRRFPHASRPPAPAAQKDPAQERKIARRLASTRDLARRS